MTQSIQYIYLFLLAVSFTACEDFLTREPSNEVSKDEIFEDIQGAEMAINGVYYILTDYSELYREDILTYGELKGGNLKYGGDILSGAKDPWLPSYEFQNDEDDDSSDAMQDLYDVYYEVLYATNAVIEGMPGVLDGTEQQQNQIMAEALTLRALIHFDLARLYAKPYAASEYGNDLGVVTLTENIDTKTFPSRSKLYETYEQIIEDLTDAIELYDGYRQSSTGSTDFEPLAFATKEAAQALLARVYLYQNDWNNAAEIATELINKSAFALLSNQNYVQEWEAYNTLTSEDIWVLDMSNNQQSNVGTNFGYDADENFENRDSDFSFTSDILNLYDEEDIRRQLFALNGNGDIVTKKYMVKSNYEEYRILFRLSEIYLIRAEASARKGDYVTARSDLETIRYRANPNADPILLSGQELIDEILIEKRREFVGEGHLFFDIKRTLKPVIRSDFNGVDNQNVEANDFQFVLPIPQDALDKNPNLIQNEGY